MEGPAVNLLGWAVERGLESKMKVEASVPGALRARAGPWAFIWGSSFLWPPSLVPPAHPPNAQPHGPLRWVRAQRVDLGVGVGDNSVHSSEVRGGGSRWGGVRQGAGGLWGAG